MHSFPSQEVPGGPALLCVCVGWPPQIQGDVSFPKFSVFHSLMLITTPQREKLKSQGHTKSDKFYSILQHGQFSLGLLPSPTPPSTPVVFRQTTTSLKNPGRCKTWHSHTWFYHPLAQQSYTPLQSLFPLPGAPPHSGVKESLKCTTPILSLGGSAVS